MMTLIQTITRLTVLVPVELPWETCALHLLQKHQPLSVSFICKSVKHCPVSNFYKKLQMPSRTLFGLEAHELPVFHRHELVFFVADNVVTWNDKATEKYRRRGGNDFKLVVVATENSFEYDFQCMAHLFNAMWLSGIVQCAVLLVNNTSSRLYSYIPFKNESLCEDTTPVLIGNCSRGVNKVFDLNKLLNLNQCPLRSATSDKSTFRRDKLYGDSGYIITEISKRMNASIELVKVSSGGVGGICGPRERTGMRGMVYNGTTHMAVGGFNQNECATLEYIGSSYTTCLSWCTPVLSRNDYVYSFLVKQLSPYVWIALIISILAVSASFVVLAATLNEDWFGNEIFKVAFFVCGQPAHSKPRTAPVRIVVAVWLLSCIVIRAAYEGELKSQSAFQLDTHIIRDLEELLNTDMMLCASLASIQIFQSMDNPMMRTIAEKALDCEGSTGRGDLFLHAAYQKDRALFLPSLFCRAADSELSREKTVLYSGTGGCLKVMEVSPIVTLRGSPFKRRWRVLLKRFVQADLISKWLSIKPIKKDQGKSHVFSVGHLLPALFAYGVGCVVGLSFFVVEKIYFKWSQRRFQRSACFFRVQC